MAQVRSMVVFGLVLAGMAAMACGGDPVTTREITQKDGSGGCSSDGEPCYVDEDCCDLSCDGTVCGTGGGGGCLSDGEFCFSSFDCCDDDCENGVCGAAAAPKVCCSLDCPYSSPTTNYFCEALSGNCADCATYISQHQDGCVQNKCPPKRAVTGYLCSDGAYSCVDASDCQSHGGVKSTDWCCPWNPPNYYCDGCDFSQSPPSCP